MDDECDSSAQGREERIRAHDVKLNNLDLRNLRPTYLPFNKRVFLSGPLKDNEEIEIQNLKRKLIETTNQYIHNTTHVENLTQNEKEGLKSLKKREYLVIFQTDKSGRFSVDSKENYEKACETHIKNDSTIDEADHLKCQK